MKKTCLIIVMILCCFFLQAQNYYHVYDIHSLESYHTYYFCDNYDGVALHGESSCNYFTWAHNGQSYPDNPLIITRANQGEWSYQIKVNGLTMDAMDSMLISSTFFLVLASHLQNPGPKTQC